MLSVVGISRPCLVSGEDTTAITYTENPNLRGTVPFAAFGHEA